MDVLNVECLRQIRRQLQSAPQHRCQLHDLDKAIGARNLKPAAREFDVGNRRFEHMRSDLTASLDHLLARPDDRGAARHQ